MLEKTTRFILLYDFYQDLLTEKQKQFAELYFQDDYSLGEIAEEFGITRQAIYEHIKRAETLLEEYESKLQLLSKHEQRIKLIDDLEHLLENDLTDNVNEAKEKITLLKRLE